MTMNKLRQVRNYSRNLSDCSMLTHSDNKRVYGYASHKFAIYKLYISPELYMKMPEHALAFGSDP